VNRTVERRLAVKIGILIAFAASPLLADALYADTEPASTPEPAPAKTATGGPASASPSRPPRQPFRAWTTEDRLRQLTRTLSLSSEQQVKVKVILDHRLARALQIRSDNSVSALDRARRLQALDRSVVEEIKQVLTPSQLQKYDPAGGRPWPGGGPPSQSTTAG
jgi:hypothetical protein